MPDNLEIIKRRLGRLGLGVQREREIARELADHIDDHAAELQANEVRPEDAVDEPLDGVSDWTALRSEIIAAETEEESMNQRTRVFWLPAFCTFLLSALLLAGLQIAGYQPRIYWVAEGLFIPFYLPWLLTLPVIGAIGAFWSQRAGGTTWHRVLVSFAPWTIWMVMLLLIGAISLPFVLFFNRQVPNISGVIFVMKGLLALVVTWWLLPGFSLLVGATPFLVRRQHAQA